MVLGYKLVASRDIGLGRLVVPFGPEMPLPGRSYYFVCAKGQESGHRQGVPRLAVRGDRGDFRFKLPARCPRSASKARDDSPGLTRARTQARRNRK